LGPVLVTGLERLLDENPTETRAVDEEIRRELAPVFELERAHVAVRGLQHAGNLRVDAPHPERLRELG